MSHYELDARRLLCPLPVIRAQNRIKDLQPGDILDVICTDPGAKNDIPAWCRIHGHSIAQITQGDYELVVRIVVGAK